MTYDPTKTLCLQLRDAARVHRDEDTRTELKALTDEIQQACGRFAVHATGDSLVLLNGLWARGVRALLFAENDGGDDGDSGGALREGARLAA